MDTRTDMRRSRGVPELFGDLLTQGVSLIRTETQLVRSEMSEKISRAGIGIALLVAGAVLLIPALVILLQALVVLLIDRGHEGQVAAAMVGGGTLLTGALVAAAGAMALRSLSILPERAIEQLRSDADMARERIAN